MKPGYQCLFINPRDMIGAWPYMKFTSMAAELLDRKISCHICDPGAEHLSHQDILDEIKNSSPAIICIGVQPSTLPDAYQLIKKIKHRFPGSVIAVEGYHIAAEPSIIIELGVPYGFRGDVEKSFADFCDSVLGGYPIDPALPGMISQTSTGLVANEYAIIKHLDELPDPAFGLLPIGKYYSASHSKKYMTLNTSRGCPYKCNFCANESQLTFRYFSVDRVIKQLQTLVGQYQVQWIEFLDLTFTIHKNRTRDLCQSIISSGLKFEWACQTRVDAVDEELLELMYLSGCRKIAFGVESGSERIRNSAIKPIQDEDFLKVFALCKKKGIKPMANFVLGHPSETMADMKATLDFAMKLQPFNALFTRMVPLPDVAVFETGIREGVFRRTVWREYMRGEHVHPSYHPPLISADQIDRFYRKAYLRFYLSPATLKNYAPLFMNPLYLYRTIKVFISLVFGSLKFSYC